MPRTKTHEMKCFVGIDNGVSGAIGILSNTPKLFPTPTFKEQNYTKAKGNISRVDHIELRKLLFRFHYYGGIKMCLLERPMVNPTRFKATSSALRALESTLIILEILEIPYAYIDSKEWQKELLPKGTKGNAELKKASKEIACRLFPSCKDVIEKQKDGDGLLIAEYCRRIYG